MVLHLLYLSFVVNDYSFSVFMTRMRRIKRRRSQPIRQLVRMATRHELKRSELPWWIASKRLSSVALMFWTMRLSNWRRRRLWNHQQKVCQCALSISASPSVCVCVCVCMCVCLCLCDGTQVLKAMSFMPSEHSCLVCSVGQTFKLGLKEHVRMMCRAESTMPLL